MFGSNPNVILTGHTCGELSAMSADIIYIYIYIYIYKLPKLIRCNSSIFLNQIWVEPAQLDVFKRPKIAPKSPQRGVFQLLVEPAQPTFPKFEFSLDSHTATHCNTLQHTQHTATHCNTLQHTTTHCNTLQHTATHCNTFAVAVCCRPRAQMLALGVCFLRPCPSAGRRYAASRSSLDYY